MDTGAHRAVATAGVPHGKLIGPERIGRSPHLKPGGTARGQQTRPLQLKGPTLDERGQPAPNALPLYSTTAGGPQGEPEQS